MAKNTSYKHQMEVVRNLEIAPRQDAEMLSYSVEEWAGGIIAVSRTYRPLHVKSMGYHELITIGQRGGKNVIFSNFQTL